MKKLRSSIDHNGCTLYSSRRGKNVFLALGFRGMILVAFTTVLRIPHEECPPFSPASQGKTSLRLLCFGALSIFRLSSRKVEGGLARSHSVLNGEEGLVRTGEEEETWINWKAASLLFPSGPFSKTLCAQGGRLAKVGGVGRYEQHTRSHRERYGGRRRRERMCPLPLCLSVAVAAEAAFLG